MSVLLGRYQDVLADAEVDCVICDPPYGGRTHKGHNAGVKVTTGRRYEPNGTLYERKAIDYDHWGVHDVHDFVEFWAPRNRGWFACMTSHELISPWTLAYEAAGLLPFAPVAIMTPGATVRLTGDGPASWTVYLMVARPRNRTYSRWGSLPGGYIARRGDRKLVGGKPLSLMLEIVRDYSRPGDLVCDPCAGHATTLLAAQKLGREFVGAEMDETRYNVGLRRIGGDCRPCDMTPLEAWASRES